MAPQPDRLDISVLSTEYVRVQQYAKENGVTIDPTAYDVWMAFLPSGTNPGLTDWVIAGWETDGMTYYSRCNVGPDGGDISLPVGTYRIWTKIEAAPEVPVKTVGTLNVF